MKTKWILTLAILVGLSFLLPLCAAEKREETDEMRRERARQVEERRRNERFGGALIFPKAKTNSPADAPKKS